MIIFGPKNLETFHLKYWDKNISLKLSKPKYFDIDIMYVSYEKSGWMVKSARLTGKSWTGGRQRLP